MPIRPSLRALHAFAEVCARGGVAPAARALGVSPSAVSHLLAELERTLGVALFAGRGPRAPLTEAGGRLRAGLGGAFGSIEAAVADAVRRSGELRVSALATFSTLWLIPRLPRLRAARPDLRLLLSTDTRPVDLATDPFDCAVRHGGGTWPGVEAILLFRERLVAVANPRLLAEFGGDPARLPRVASRSAPDDWPLLERTFGLQSAEPAAVVENRALAVQAALAGVGVAAVDARFVEALVAAGLLAHVAPGTGGVETGGGFYLIARPERLRDPNLRAFRDWMLVEVGTINSAR